MFVREYVNKRHKSLQHGARYKCCLIESARRVDCPKQSAQYLKSFSFAMVISKMAREAVTIE